MAQRTPLSDDELDAYAHHARAESNEPLASLVAELQQRRKVDDWQPWAIVVLAAGQAGLLPALVSSRSGPVLVIAPDGTRLPTLGDKPKAWALETYDPAAPLELRQLLQIYGIGR